MNLKTRINIPSMRSYFMLIIFVLLTACGGGGGSDDPAGGGNPNDQVDESSVGSPISSPTQIPENLISFEDASVTVAAFRQGLDLDFDVLRTQFYCYNSYSSNDVPIIDFSEPDAILSITDNGFSATTRNSTDITSGTIRENPNSNSLYLQPSGGEETRFSIHFDSFGQYLTSRELDNLAGCYQVGSSNERAVHQYQLNTPELAVFSCSIAEGGAIVAEQVPLTLGENNQYAINGEVGIYLYQDIFKADFSLLSFSSGPLSSWSGQYSELPNTGLQRISLSQGSSDNVALCERTREPRPFKRFGAGVVTPPSPSSRPLTGVYFLNTQNPEAVGWLEATADGFFNTEDPMPGGTNCTRVQPNGLERCSKYVYNGGNTIKLFGGDEEFDLPIFFDNDGGFNIPSVFSYQRVRTPTLAELAGQWQLQVAINPLDNIDISLCILGFCQATGTLVRTFEFSEDGRFRLTDDSSLIGSANAFNVFILTTSNENDSQTGTYEINGSSITLSHPSGEIDPPVYMHLKDENTLVIDTQTYRKL